MKNLVILAGTLLLAMGNVPARAEQADEKELADKRLEFMLNSVRDFDLLPDADAEHPWKLDPTPLLRWSNPVGGVPDGIIVMWTDGARPSVLAQVFQTKDGYWVHEFQSVALGPFVMRAGNQVAWEPRKAGVEFRRIDDVQPPADSRIKRLTQMRNIVQRFAAYDDFKIRATDTETTRHELRLMPKPLYRYEVLQQQVVDGALFAFALGTDPELFILLEARDNAGGDRSWHYALAAMTAWAVEVKYNDKSIWSVGERLRNHSPRGDYHSSVFDRQAK